MLCGCLSRRACFTVESGSKNSVSLAQKLLGYEEKIFCPLCRDHGVMPVAVNPVLAPAGMGQGSVSG